MPSISDSNTDQELSSIRAKIIDKTYALRENENKNCKAKHWSTFRSVLDEQGKTLKDIYACSKSNCSLVIKANLASDGTGKLKRHYIRCNREDLNVINGIESYFDKTYRPPPAKRFKKEHKHVVNDAALSFVVNDMRPVDSVTKSGLVTLLAVFTQIGSTYGKMSSDEVLDILPSRFSVSSITKLHRALGLTTL